MTKEELEEAIELAEDQLQDEYERTGYMNPKVIKEIENMKKQLRKLN